MEEPPKSSIEEHHEAKLSAATIATAPTTTRIIETRMRRSNSSTGK